MDHTDKDLVEKAKYLLQLIAGTDMPMEEYMTKLDLVHDQLLVVYSTGYHQAVKETDVFQKETVRPHQPED